MIIDRFVLSANSTSDSDAVEDVKSIVLDFFAIGSIALFLINFLFEI
jgi:hypothetical protein